MDLVRDVSYDETLLLEANELVDRARWRRDGRGGSRHDVRRPRDRFSFFFYLTRRILSRVGNAFDLVTDPSTTGDDKPSDASFLACSSDVSARWIRRQTSKEDATLRLSEAADAISSTKASLRFFVSCRIHLRSGIDPRTNTSYGDVRSRASKGSKRWDASLDEAVSRMTKENEFIYGGFGTSCVRSLDKAFESMSTIVCEDPKARRVTRVRFREETIAAETKDEAGET